MRASEVEVLPRLQVLGGFSLRSGTGHLLRVNHACQRLLALLAVSRLPVHRSVLSQRLWPDADGARAGANLRSVLWRLPKPHAVPLVDIARGDVRLSSSVRVDLWDSERWARSLTDRVPTEPGSGLGRAGDLGLENDLLPQWSEEWLDIEQECYRQLRLHALEQRSRLLCREGRYSAALAAALAAVSGEPLRESAHRCVISVHLAEGNPAEALRQFHAYRRLLAHELGLPPSPAIRELVVPLLGRPLDGWTRHTA
jgi:DNA-binding SARP family transcriptional activator